VSLFAERFLVAPVGPEPPEPAGYDEVSGISLTADGRPFIEAGATLGTRTLTEAEGEGGDDDEDRAASGAGTSDALPATRTAPFVDVEGLDTDDDSHGDRLSAAALAADTLSTITRADGERPDATPWAHTKTSAPGEPVDYDASAFLATVTKAAGESAD
jgi:hypothetical protein